MSTTGFVVVGVDGSATARTALMWATEEAARRHLAVRVVTAHTAGSPEPVVATAQVADVTGSYPEVRIEHHRLDGPPGRTLVEAAEDAALLVVGSRGATGVLSTLLGSATAYCLRHAHCPVVVVPPASTTQPVVAQDTAVPPLTPGPLL
ncbi:universal stress protein [Actinokineospora bangkokensis]|uniref:UspA domain-containing protein n=1 Tax=Actinokineospora bangkokensis TaxID=1193682 RepID=A0A1Q9LR10_9PSEU|nr:universal stress protein [Actinokineospora bangkokensis]OLR94469.1 hypothetical protein BJP25_12010 [Actinokineospora bangkokensis]